MTEPLLTIPEAAADLRVSERTLRRILKTGNSALRIVQVSPGRVALKQTDLERYKSQQVREPGPCLPKPPKPRPSRPQRSGNVVSFTELMARQAVQGRRSSRDDRV